MPISRTDSRLFKGTTEEILAYAPPLFTGWTYAESTDDHGAFRWNSTTAIWEPLGVAPTNISVYVDPVTGDDDAAGTAEAPLLSLSAAFKRCSRGWLTTCVINLAAGIYVEPASALISIPGGIGVGADPLLLVGTSEDSGLGLRTAAAGGTAGSGGVFGTIVDAAGGLTPSAFKGWTLRIVGGPNDGREYVVDDNSATTFMLVGSTLVGAITSGNFVIERPASVIQSADGVMTFLAGSGSVFGMRHVRLDGQGGTSSLRVRGVNLLYSGIWVQNFSQVTADYMGAISVLPASGAGFFSSLNISLVGGYFVSSVVGATMRVLRNSMLDSQRTLIDGYHGDYVGACTINFVSCSFRGASSQRASFGVSFNAGSSHLTGVTGFSSHYGIGAIVCEHGVSASISNMDISGTTGAGADAIILSGGSNGIITSTTGTGNAGYGVRLAHKSELGHILNTSLTGAAGDVLIGGNAAPTNWATLLTTNVTDLGANQPQLCMAGP